MLREAQAVVLGLAALGSSVAFHLATMAVEKIKKIGRTPEHQRQLPRDIEASEQPRGQRWPGYATSFCQPP
jgi:glutamyl-tRNA reductase